MNKILYCVIAITIITCLATTPAFATDTTEVLDTSYDAAASDTVETNEAATECDTVLSANEETVTESAVESVDDNNETEDMVAIITGAENRVDAIVKIAGAMGITLEEAEAMLEKMVLLGDEHFGESDIWSNVKDSMLQNPEAWTVVALVVLMLVALTVFIIRGLIKNTTAQAATKINIADIKKKELEISERLNAAANRLIQIENEHAEIKCDIDEIRALASVMREVVTACKDETYKISEMAVSMLGAVDLLKSNSEASLEVNKEQALQTVQLLNIAMGRKLPNVSDSTRRVWYEDAVNKIKNAAKDNTAEAEDEK